MTPARQTGPLVRDWLAALHNGRGHGVKIGLLDTGIDSRHPDLIGRVATHHEARVDAEAGRVVPSAHGNDPHEHGTACAGILSRLAPGAEIHSVQIIGDNPRDSPLKLIAALRFAIEQGWDIIDINAGSGNAPESLRSLLDTAWEAGQIVVAAKDNRPGVTGFPAAFPNVLGVDMDHFSDPFDFRFDPDAEVEVEANGIYIDAPLAGGGRRLFTGSSFAAPHVAAIAARLKERCPELDGALFREALAVLSQSGAGF